MILKVFLPERLKGIQILSQKVVGIAIEDSMVHAAKIIMSQSKITVLKLEKEPIEHGDEETRLERTAHALRNIHERLGTYDALRISLASSVAIFRDLTLPFLEPEKIRMVLEYEIESKLPFPLDEALIDFIIIDQNKEKKESTVIAVAVQKEEIKKNLAIYQAAGIEPTSITVSLLALYGLYQQVPPYQNLSHASSLIYMGIRSTSIAFIENTKLRLIRNIPKGLASLAELINKDTSIPYQDIIESIYSFGVQKTNDNNYNQSLEKHLVNILNEIQFTLNSFSIKLDFFGTIEKLIFSGAGAAVPKLASYSSSILQVPTENFDIEHLFSNPRIKTKISLSSSELQPFTLALATAIPQAQQIDFNLRKKEFAFIDKKIISQQLIALAVLFFSIIGIISLLSFLHISSLGDHAQSFEEQEIKKLKKIFPPESRSYKKTVLSSMLRDAETLIEEKEEMWAPFSQQRLRPLFILQELTRIIDRKKYNVSVDELIINTNEDGVVYVKITGLFQSKPGTHYKDFGIFQKSFEESRVLDLVELPDTTPSENGVIFNVLLKQRELSL